MITKCATTANENGNIHRSFMFSSDISMKLIRKGKEKYPKQLYDKHPYMIDSP